MSAGPQHHAPRRRPGLAAADVIGPGYGETLTPGGLALEVKVHAAQTRGRLAVHEHQIPPGALIPPHCHEEQDQFAYVLAGMPGFLAGDREIRAVTGSCVHLPAGQVHAAWNPGPSPVALLVITSPGDGTEGLCRDLTGMESLTSHAAAQIAAPYGVTFRDDLRRYLEDRHGVSANPAQVSP